MFEKHAKAKNAANANVPAGTKVTIDYNDVQTPAILLFLSSMVMAILASHILMALIQDMYHIIPESIARRLKLTGKTLSTSTLAYQAVGLAFSTILVIIPLGFLTASAFTKEAKVVVTENGVVMGCPSNVGMLDNLCLQMIYDKTPYILINAQLPWATVLFGIIGTLVTFVAWYRRSQYISEAVPEPSAEPLGTESRFVDGRLQDVESMTKQVAG